MNTVRHGSRAAPAKPWSASTLAHVGVANSWLHVLLTVGIVFGVAGCEHVRRVTYPPDFTYLSDDTVTSSMGRMARHVGRLEALLQDVPPDGQIDRDAVVVELKQLEDVARRLGAGPRTTNHLLIDAHIDSFGSDIWQARRAVERDPPNYYLVGQVTGSCSACHVRR